MQKIAIIGTGIAGMTCAWYLRNHYRVTLLEKASYAGGHTNTIAVEEDEQSVPIDTGFMVYNDQTYPNLLRLFEELGVPEVDTNMSFGVTNDTTGFSFSSTGFRGFFANRMNVLNPNYWNLVNQIRRFFKHANRFIDDPSSGELTLREFLCSLSLDRLLGPNFIYPMASAIWSTHSERIEDYPAKSLFKFMRNHGLLGFGDQFTWKTIQGGSRIYRDRILAKFLEHTHLKCSINHISENTEGVSLSFKDQPSQQFDYVIVATHADQALKLLKTPTETQHRLLSPFEYNQNEAVLHTDTSVMPKYRDAWASWNYRCSHNEGDELQASTHYWMNRLQHLDTNNQYFVSIDHKGRLDPELIKWSARYTHPCFNQSTVDAQRELPSLNENNRIKFCGSYFRNGFHEDAHVSALNVVKIFKQMKGLDHEILPV